MSSTRHLSNLKLSVKIEISPFGRYDGHPKHDFLSRKNSIFGELTCAVWFVKENRLNREKRFVQAVNH